MKLTFPFTIAGQAAANLYSLGAGVRSWVYGRVGGGRERLCGKVVSIGNIGFGGTGKTPFTIWLAKRLSAAGLRPSILTRGYGRTSAERVRFFLPGAAADDARADGDEVQLYLRHTVNVPVGIADSRYAAGKMIEERFRVDLHLLDDGFQHFSLARNLDLVLIDGRNPWGARWGIPRVLRESPRALRRADAILITNCADAVDGTGRRLQALREELRKLNPEAPQFHAFASIAKFVERHGGGSLTPEAMKRYRALAFCGVGSPANFFSALEAVGVRCLERRTFHDHHRYRAEDLKGLEARARQLGANCLLATEKDLVNLPAKVKVGIPLYWAELRFEVKEEAQLLRWMSERLELSMNPAAIPSQAAGRDGAQSVATVSGLSSS